MPASSSAATIASQASCFSEAGSRLANGVWPMPAIAVRSLITGYRLSGLPAPTG
jgi:hypothetical protein